MLHLRGLLTKNASNNENMKTIKGLNSKLFLVPLNLKKVN